MDIDFRLEAIPRERFENLLELGEEELRAHHAKWVEVDAEPGYPCRVSLEDAKIGERVLLVTYTHHDVDSPYRASGPIFVRELCRTRMPDIDEIPQMLHHRLLSLRAYDSRAMLAAAEVIEGNDLRNAIHDMFETVTVEYIHIHNARPGCFNCTVRRV